MWGVKAGRCGPIQPLRNSYPNYLSNLKKLYITFHRQLSQSALQQQHQDANRSNKKCRKNACSLQGNKRWTNTII